MATASGSHVLRQALSGTSKFLVDAAGTGALLLLMFAVGVEFRTYRPPQGRPSRRWQLVLPVTLPIVLCGAAAWPFAPQLTAANGNPFYAWSFVGIALSVTAVPVLALVIDDLRIGSMPLSGATMRISVLTDGAAWTPVTIMLIATARHSSALEKLGTGIVLLTAVVVLPRIINRYSIFEENAARAIAMFACALTGASATQLLGLHPALGAVIAGYYFPAALTNPSAKQALGHH